MTRLTRAIPVTGPALAAGPSRGPRRADRDGMPSQVSDADRVGRNRVGGEVPVEPERAG